MGAHVTHEEVASEYAGAVAAAGHPAKDSTVDVGDCYLYEGAMTLGSKATSIVVPVVERSGKPVDISPDSEPPAWTLNEQARHDHSQFRSLARAENRGGLEPEDWAAWGSARSWSHASTSATGTSSRPSRTSSTQSLKEPHSSSQPSLLAAPVAAESSRGAASPYGRLARDEVRAGPPDLQRASRTVFTIASLRRVNGSSYISSDRGCLRCLSQEGAMCAQCAAMSALKSRPPLPSLHLSGATTARCHGSVGGTSLFSPGSLPTGQSLYLSGATSARLHRREDGAWDKDFTSLDVVYDAALVRSEVERQEANAERRQAQEKLDEERKLQALERLAWAKERRTLQLQLQNSRMSSPGCHSPQEWPSLLQEVPTASFDIVRGHPHVPRSRTLSSTSGQRFDVEGDNASPRVCTADLCSPGAQQEVALQSRWQSMQSPSPDMRLKSVLNPSSSRPLSPVNCSLWADTPDDASVVAVVDCQGSHGAWNNAADSPRPWSRAESTQRIDHREL